MKSNRIISILLTICILLGSIPFSISAYATEETEAVSDETTAEEIHNSLRLEDLIAGEDYVEDEIIVSSKVEDAEDILSELSGSYGMNNKYCLSECVGDSQPGSASDTVTYVMSLEEGAATVPEIISDLEKDEDIIYAQPNYIYQTSEDTEAYTGISETEAKTYANSQKAMFDTLNYTWSETGGDGVKVAVIDSGIDLDHPALNGALWCEDGVYGYNTSDPDNITEKTMEDCDSYTSDHGTHVAGIIAMQQNGTEYTLRGIAPGVEIIDIQASYSGGYFKTTSLIAALEMAVVLGAEVVNLSLGGTAYDFAWNIACNNASRSMVIVAAAGNNGNDTIPSYPAAFSSVIGVMAYGGAENPSVYNNQGHNITDNESFLEANYSSSEKQILAKFSNYDLRSRYYDIVAPGVNICSASAGGTGNVNGYEFKNGTSMASPIIAAVAALYIEAHPSATAGQVRTALKSLGEGEDKELVYIYNHLIVPTISSSVTNKININNLLLIPIDTTINNEFAYSNEAGYEDLCNLIKTHLGYETTDNITITNDDLNLISYLQINSYSEIDNSIDKLEELSRLIGLKLNGYSFSDEAVNSIIEDNELIWLETFEIINSNTYRIYLNSSFGPSIKSIKFNRNKNLKCVDNLNELSKLKTIILENNNISNVDFLGDMSTFYSLYLSGNYICDAKPILNNSRLKEINLSNNAISDYKDFMHLSDAYTVDLSFNYLSEYEEEIEELLDSNEEHPILIYKPYKDDYVAVEDVILNDFSVKRTEVDYTPRITVVPGDATLANNTILSGSENDFITVDEYTGKINYNPAYVPTASEDFVTEINYQNESVSGSANVKLLVPTIDELNFEQYIFDSSTQNYISLLTNIDTTKVKVVRSGNGESIEFTDIENTEYYTDIGDTRIISFPYNYAIESDETITVYTGDSISSEYDSEVISDNNKISITVEGQYITNIDGASTSFLRIIEHEDITGIEKQELLDSEESTNEQGQPQNNIEILYLPANVSFFGKEAFKYDNYNINTVILCSSELVVDSEETFTGSEETMFYTLPDSQIATSYSEIVNCCSDFNFSNGTLVNYAGSSTEVVIPECLGITAIGNAAFKNNAIVTKVTLSDGIEKIYDNAFYGCSKLTEVNNTDKITYIGAHAFRNTKISNLDITSVTYIGDYAFYGCTSLTEIDIIGDLNEQIFDVNNYTFYGCTNLECLSYKGTIRTGNYSFRNCKKLPEIICDDVYLNGTGSFYGCIALKTIDLSEESDIKPSSFYGCTALENIAPIKKKAIQIGANAFKGTTSLKEIGFLSATIVPVSTAFNGCNENLIVYCNPNVLNTTAVTVCTDFELSEVDGNIVLTKYNGSAENVVIPDCLNIYEIGKKAFYYKPFLKSVHFPGSLRIISDQAFSMDMYLEEVTGGKNVTKLGDRAFYNNKKLSNVSNFESLQYLDYACLAYTDIGYYEIPHSVYYCYQFVFLGCKSLKEIVLSGNLYTVPSGMFYNCINLERCVVKFGTKVYGQQIFDGCESLKHIYIPDSAQLIQSNSIINTVNVYTSKNLNLNSNNISLSNNEVFPNYDVVDGVLLEYQSESGYDYIDEDGKKVIDVPNAVEEIAKRVFSSNKSAEKVILSDYLDVIGEYAFSSTSVETVIMPKEMSSIGESAFYNSTKLANITIPEGIEYIEKNTFYLTKISGCEIPASVKTVKAGAFRYCSNLKSVYIPDTVVIASTAFANCYTYTFFWSNNSSENGYLDYYSERFGNNTFISKVGYTVIDNVLVAYTGNENNVQIPFCVGINAIADGAFKNNTNVESVSIASGITNIGEECFSGCTSLTAIFVPDDIVSVGTNAFAGVQNLTVYCNSGSYIEEYCIANNISVNTDFDISDGILNKYNGTDENVVVPSNLCVVEIGVSAFSSNKSLKSAVVPEGVMILGSSFVSCTALESVILPSTLRKMKSLAFLGCNNLRNINIPDGLKTISGYAFARCSSLESIDLSNVETILYNAFEECTNLTDIVLGSSLSSIGEDAFENCSDVIFNCYADTYAHQYAIDNNIPYVLIDETTQTMFSLERTTPDSSNEVTSEEIEEYVAIDPEMILYNYIQDEYNGEISDENLQEIADFMISNGWW